MKLLFDQNLSFKLCEELADLFPGSKHVRSLGLATASDGDIWQVAKADGLAIVSLDSDFAELAALLGPPPKVIWLRGGNRPTAAIAGTLRWAQAGIAAFFADANAACLEIYAATDL